MKATGAGTTDHAPRQRRAVGHVPDPEDYVSQGVRQYTDHLLSSADPTSIAIVLALWQANHSQMLANHRAMEALDLPVSVAGNRLTVLRTLYFAPGRSMSLGAISKATGISPTMVTNLVDSLRRGGLVQRAGSPDDRRVSIAYLTPEGEETFLKVLPVLSERMSQACADFGEEEKQQLLSLLRRLII